MTNREAIETIKIAVAEVEWNYPMEYTVAFEIAIETLKKQIPMKPKEYEDKFYACPVCGNVVHAYDNYCSFCGQKLNWRVEDE